MLLLNDHLQRLMWPKTCQREATFDRFFNLLWSIDNTKATKLVLHLPFQLKYCGVPDIVKSFAKYWKGANRIFRLLPDIG